MDKNCITITCYVMNEGKMLFLKHKKLGVWMPPGGHVDDNENPIGALHREVMEETGLTVDIIDTYKSDSHKKYVKDEKAEEMVKPLIILLESVSYQTGIHKHFDMVYLGVTNKRIGENRENHDMTWIGKDGIEQLDTYDNVKEIAYVAFDAYQKYTQTNLK